MVIEIILDGAPMGKQRVQLRRSSNHLFTPDKTVNYEGRLAVEGQRIMAGRPLLDGPLEAEIEAYIQMPKNRPKGTPKDWFERALKGVERPTGKPDFDNICKIMCDGLNLIVWTDDSRIVTAKFSKWYTDRPRTILRVWEIKNEGVFR